MAAKFFDERKDQSEIKARIVSKYFFVWARIVGVHSERVAYIDLFAGPGRYKDGAMSTPLMVLEKVIAEPKLAKALVSFFNDQDEEASDSLLEEIRKLPGIDTLKYEPQVGTGDVGDDIAKFFNDTKMVPTFSFIDPFGYKGLSQNLVRGAIKDWGSDCVFFFNYNRINAGISNPGVAAHMDALFGAARAGALRKLLPTLSPALREAAILQALTDAIRELGGKYVLPFGFKNASGKRSSHYLVFVCKHERGYEIMKEIMAKESSTTDQGVPSFSYSPADATTPLLFSLQRSLDQLEDDLANKYAGKTLKMIDIYRTHHVDTPFIKPNYKAALLNLEKAGRISAEPAKRKSGTFADEVLVSFPKKKANG